MHAYVCMNVCVYVFVCMCVYICMHTCFREREVQSNLSVATNLTVKCKSGVWPWAWVISWHGNRKLQVSDNNWS